LGCGTVEIRHDDGAWVLLLHGEHDISTAASLRLELERAFAAGSAVIVDLSNVEFLDSTVLANVVYGGAQAGRHAEHGFSVVAPPGSLARRLADLVALESTIGVYSNRDDAIAAAHAQQESSA